MGPGLGTVREPCRHRRRLAPTLRLGGGRPLPCTFRHRPRRSRFRPSVFGPGRAVVGPGRAALGSG
eukprot:2274647-Lingulodinium_polyedra.AAC.1